MSDFAFWILMIAVIVLFFWYMNRSVNKARPSVAKQEPYPYKEGQKEFLVDYFHWTEGHPDYDGYVGRYTIPEEIMELYREKHKGAWGEEE